MPKIAEPDFAAGRYDNVTRMSQPFGTRFRVDATVGHVLPRGRRRRTRARGNCS